MARLARVVVSGYRWSSAARYVLGRDDGLTDVSWLNKKIDNWREFLKQNDDLAVCERLRKHERTGRPLGNERFIFKLERILDRALVPKKAGHKPKNEIQEKEK